MSESRKEEYIEALVNAVKKRNDAPMRSDEFWRDAATLLCEGIVLAGGVLDRQRIPQIADLLIDNANRQTQRIIDYVPPPTFDHSASTLGTDTNKRKLYERDVLPSGFMYGSFVHVPSYIAFLKAMKKSFEFSAIARRIMNEQVTAWCPKEGRTTDLETPRSCQLGRILAHELRSDDCTVVHQTPILPDSKPSSKQDVDIAVFCEETTSGDGQVAVLLEYKPRNNFDDFEAQSACYGTDYMSVSQRSVLGVQVHGTDMNCLNIRAFGIVPWISESNKPPFRKVMLMEGKNEAGLKMLISGIKGYLQNYKTEIKGTFMEYMLSNVTSLHKKSRKVVKGYDYRDRNVAEQDRRKPNIELVREFIDSNAEETEIDDDLCIVTTKFYGREDGQKWFHRVPAAMLGRLLENLQTLHGKGFVHGDIRLLNCILHTGMIVDFDFCRREGERYPSTLRLLKRDGSDGGRAQDVVQAIADSTVGSLGMEKSHDLESMLYLLQLFRPVVSGPEAGSTFSGWWDRNVKGRANFLDLFELIGPLKEFASKSDLVELSLSVDGGRAI